jgi:hypothetical protein
LQRQQETGRDRPRRRGSSTNIQHPIGVVDTTVAVSAGHRIPEKYFRADHQWNYFVP